MSALASQVAAAALMAGPFGLEVNRHRWSPGEVAGAVERLGSEREAIRGLAIHALLRQEASAFGVPHLDDSAFLAHLFRESAVCDAISEADLARGYQRLRRRFDHPPLATVSELAWSCGPAEPEPRDCTRRAHAAGETWLGLLDAVRDGDDLYALAAAWPAMPLEIRETTWATPALESKIGNELSLPETPQSLTPGTSWVTLSPGGARLRVVVAVEAETHTTLAHPGTRDAVRADLCRRRLAAARSEYVEGLLGSALIRKVPR